MADYNWLAQQRAARMPAYTAGNQKGPSALEQAVSPVATALGAGIGFIIGGPPGALAGASIGASAGQTGKDIANHKPITGDLMGLGTSIAGAGGAVPQTPISTQGGGTMPGLPIPSVGTPTPFPPPPNFMDLLQGRPMGFAAGGLVPDPNQLLQFLQGANTAQPDPFQNATPESLAGPAPQPQAMLQPGHPTWEMLAQVIPAIISQLPGPNPKNQGTVGSRYLPALATAVTMPTNLGRMKREKQNEQIQKQNEADAAAHRQRVSEMGRGLAAYRWGVARDAARTAQEQAAGKWAGRGPQEQLTLPSGQQIPMSAGVASILARKELLPSEGTTPMSDAALEMEAVKYATTGQIGTFARGKEGDISRNMIRNRAAKLFPGANLGMNIATFSADKSSLTALQKMSDAVGAFESTAIKNAKILDERMQRITDLGSPALNMPVRLLNRAGLGSAEQAAYDVAVRTVQPEFARILANPTLSGQLTDTARHEMQQVVNGNYTLAQMRAAIEVLMQDAENRRNAYQSGIETIKGRISKGAGGTVDAGSVLDKIVKGR